MNSRDELIDDLKKELVNPHRTAQVMQAMYNQSDEEGLQRVRITYIDTLLDGRCRNPTRATKVVDENLYMAACLADIIKKDGMDLTNLWELQI